MRYNGELKVPDTALPDTAHLVPRDRESVLRILHEWNHPRLINLSTAKAIRGVEASNSRQEGRPEMNGLPCAITTTINEAQPVFPRSIPATYIPSDPLAGTFVRGGWRRRRVYPIPDPDSNYCCIFRVPPTLISWPVFLERHIGPAS